MPDGTCPGLGGKDVIYRTIDLNNPFPGQDAEQRNIQDVIKPDQPNAPKSSKILNEDTTPSKK